MFYIWPDTAFLLRTADSSDKSHGKYLALYIGKKFKTQIILNLHTSVSG